MDYAFNYRYGDYEGAAVVNFGEPKDKSLLGVVTLEALGLELDPGSHELRTCYYSECSAEACPRL